MKDCWVLPHPENEDVVFYRRWQYEIFGCEVAAALLSYFEYWHGIRLREKKRSRHLNKVATNHGDDPSQDESLLQYHTLDDIADALMGLGGKTTIKKAITRLVEHGIVSKHENPNPRYRFDRTTYYLFHPEPLIAYLAARAKAKAHGSNSSDGEDRFDFPWVKFVRWSVENDPRAVGNDPAITETTSETQKNPPTPQGGKMTVAGQTENLESEPEPATPVPRSVVESEQEQPLPRSSLARTKSSGGGRRGSKKSSIPVDVVAWVSSHNQHKPDGWAGCRSISPEGIRAVQRVIEFYDGDEATALENHALALQWVRVSPKMDWWRSINGNFLTAIRPAKIDQNIAAWAEAARATGLNPAAVVASGLDEQQIAQARTAATESLGEKMMREWVAKRAAAGGSHA